MNSFKERSADISVIYKRINGLNLPMQIFLPDENIHKAKTVLCIHGGGWNDAIKNNSPWNGGHMADNARYLAENGFIAVTASYRSLEVSKDINALDLLEDCKDMVRYMKRHMDFINSSDIIYMGDSAGGYFAVMMGLSQDDDIRPRGVAAFNPVLDSLGDKWKYAFIGADIYNAAPKNIIGDKCADFLFVHGTADETAEIEHTEELNDLLVRRGHNSNMMKIADAQHAFILYDYKYSDEYVSNIMKKTIEYINKSF